MNDDTVEDQLYCLARPPSSTICTFQGYEINGNTFYTVAQDKKSTNQNSGVRFDATDENEHCLETYYRYIEEIWELDYGPTFKIPLFAYMDKPFVLANDVAQVFYVKDMSTKTRKRNQQKKISSDDPKRHIVLLGKRNIVGVDDKTDMSEDYNKFHEIPPFKVKTDPSILLNAEDSPWLRPRRKEK